MKSRELNNSLDLKTRELINSLVFTKMLVLFIFRLLSYLCITYFHLNLCIHLLSKIVLNLRSTLKSNKFYLFSIKLKTSKSITTKNWRNYKSRELEILVFHFSLYYNVSGGGMAHRYWKIPSSSLGEKKFEFPTRGFAARGKFIFFALGFGGNFPIPPRHPSAILTIPTFYKNKELPRRFVKTRNYRNSDVLWKRYNSCITSYIYNWISHPQCPLATVFKFDKMFSVA